MTKKSWTWSVNKVQEQEVWVTVHMYLKKTCTFGFSDIWTAYKKHHIWLSNYSQLLELYDDANGPSVLDKMSTWADLEEVWIVQ